MKISKAELMEIIKEEIMDAMSEEEVVEEAAEEQTIEEGFEHLTPENMTLIFKAMAKMAPMIATMSVPVFVGMVEEFAKSPKGQTPSPPPEDMGDK